MCSQGWEPLDYKDFLGRRDMIQVQKVIEVFLEEVVVRMGCKSRKCGEDNHLRKKKNEQEQAMTAGGLGPVQWYHICWNNKEHIG